MDMKQGALAAVHQRRECLFETSVDGGTHEGALRGSKRLPSVAGKGIRQNRTVACNPGTPFNGRPRPPVSLSGAAGQ